MTISFVKRANAAFKVGDYFRAVVLYEQAILERPELSSVYSFNLKLARSKLRSDDVAISLPRSDASICLEDLYREVTQFVNELPQESFQQSQPLVSLIMTAHNVAGYIDQAVTSVLRQTYKPLEVIVVDDCSTDGTWRILQRLAGEYPIVIRRLNANLGTYFAKNVAIGLAQGEFIFFQDGDDLCHPERIRLCLTELVKLGTVCLQGSYSRVMFPTGRVLPVNGLVKKLGLITLGVRRSVFDDIGYFNCTMKASDDEFFQRLQTFYANRLNAVRTLDVPLYYNTFREGSLFADMIANDPTEDGYIVQRTSVVRQAYVDAFEALHKTLPAQKFKGVFRFPVTRDVIKVAPEMSQLVNPAVPVVASLCSIPERVELLRQTLASLAPQVDELHLYLDRYDTVPDFLREFHPKLSVRLSRDLPDLRDNGKFVPLSERLDDCYFFTADDDIEYPPDYVNAMVKKIEHYERLAVVGVHGVLIPERPVGYFSSFRRVNWFIRELEQDQLVNILGTGTVAFHSARLKGLDYRHFSHNGMVDLYLAAFCKDRAIPMVAVARPENWLVEMRLPTDDNYHQSTLFAAGMENDEKQSRFVSEHTPWGYGAIARAVETSAKQFQAEASISRLRALLPALPQCLW